MGGVSLIKWLPTTNDPTPTQESKAYGKEIMASDLQVPTTQNSQEICPSKGVLFHVLDHPPTHFPNG